ncbi:hypothetical protein CKA32_006025 [Geitlerinema sp. FC II]|nr:hypothetical protein CKA32_006025 [Geitlerinema sp. FC II]
MVQKTFQNRRLTKHIKYVSRLEPDPRHLQDAGDLRQQFTDLGFRGQPFNTAISFLARVSRLFCTTKPGRLRNLNISNQLNLKYFKSQDLTPTLDLTFFPKRVIFEFFSSFANDSSFLYITKTNVDRQSQNVLIILNRSVFDSNCRVTSRQTHREIDVKALAKVIAIGRNFKIAQKRGERLFETLNALKRVARVNLLP